MMGVGLFIGFFLVCYILATIVDKLRRIIKLLESGK